MDFSKFRDIKINVKKIDVRINPTVWDKQPILYSGTVIIDSSRHTITVVRCGFLGLPFLLVDNQPTIQLYGSHQTIAENMDCLGLTSDVRHQINRYIEYND